ncbi:MAG: HAD family phosphatase [Candidatus Methanofastidiosa archaeon]|jgi:phosphoserine phosphatase|nr:HAD family phosphatase [Candidatus Methanofastidiosa archaeon]
MRYAVVVFDLDGTLIEREPSWVTLHRYFGARDRDVDANMDAFMAGEIDYAEWMELDIALWKPHAPSVDHVYEAFKDVVAEPKTRDAVMRLKAAGAKVYIVSSGIDVLACAIGRQLGADGVYANELNADDDGMLTGTGTCRVDPQRKHEAVCEIAQKEGVPLSSVACVGDTKYDISMFEGVGGKYALNPKHQELIDAADASFDDIELLVDHMLIP